VLVAASAAHRGLAYDASRALIDRLKASVPVWKHQQFADGREEWVNSP
jgi:molybdopterin synthase catalytic subunit